MTTSKQTVKETPAPETEAVVKVEVALAHEVIQQKTASWSPAETRDAISLTDFAIAQVSKARESLMAVGERFNAFAEKHGQEKCGELARYVSALRISGLSESNIGLWRIRATEYAKMFPNPTVRKHVLALTGGEGIIIRGEKPSDDKPAPYVVAPAYVQALEKAGEAPRDSKSEDSCEKWARILVKVAGNLRGNARKVTLQTKRKIAVKAFNSLVLLATKEDKSERRLHSNGEAFVMDTLFIMAEFAVQHSEDLQPFEHLIGRLDQMLGASEKRETKQKKSA